MIVHAPQAHRAEIRLAGSGGQGLITGMHILFRALALEGRRAAQSQSYEPTSRGGFCYSDLVISDESGDYPLATRLDMVAALSQIGLDRSLPLIKPGALMIVDERLVPDPPNAGFDLHVLPIAARAVEIGSPRVANVVALGALANLGRLVVRRCPRPGRAAGNAAEVRRSEPGGGSGRTGACPRDGPGLSIQVVVTTRFRRPHFSRAGLTGGPICMVLFKDVRRLRIEAADFQSEGSACRTSKASSCHGAWP